MGRRKIERTEAEARRLRTEYQKKWTAKRVSELYEKQSVIRRYRLIRDLSQSQFAAELGVTYGLVGAWERGETKAWPDVLEYAERVVSEVDKIVNKLEAEDRDF